MGFGLVRRTPCNGICYQKQKAVPSLHSCTVLTKHVSGVFELEMNFDDGTTIENDWIFSNFGFCKAGSSAQHGKTSILDTTWKDINNTLLDTTCFKSLHFFHGLKVLMLQWYILDVCRKCHKEKPPFSNQFAASTQYYINM